MQLKSAKRFQSKFINRQNHSLSQCVKIKITVSKTSHLHYTELCMLCTALYDLIGVNSQQNCDIE